MISVRGKKDKKKKKKHCKAKFKKPVSNYIKITNVDKSPVRKFVQVKISNKNIRMQLDSGSDLNIINVYT